MDIISIWVDVEVMWWDYLGKGSKGRWVKVKDGILVYIEVDNK